MEDLKEKTVDLASHVEDLADTFYRLTVVNITQKVSNIVSGTVVILLIVSFGFFALLFIAFALGWWLGDVVNSRPAGFLLAAAFFLMLVFIIGYMRKKTIFPLVRNLIVRKMYDENDTHI
jgi:hypothetical protein